MSSKKAVVIAAAFAAAAGVAGAVFLNALDLIKQPEDIIKVETNVDPSQPPAPLKGVLESADAEGKTLPQVGRFCLPYGKQTVEFFVDSDPALIDAANKKIEAGNKTGDTLLSLPLTATDAEEKSALSVVDEDKQADTLSNTLALKTVLRDAASSMFSEYDARRFFIAETHDDAVQINKALKILRQFAFTDIAEKPSGSVQAPPASLEDDGADKLRSFLSVLTDKLDGDITPEAVTKIFRDYVLSDVDTASLKQDPVNPSVEILGTAYWLLRESYSAQTTANFEARLLPYFRDSVSSAARNDNVPVRVRYDSSTGCTPTAP